MKKIILSTISVLLLTSLVFTACKKKETEKPKEEEKPKYDNSTAPKSHAIIESAFDEMTNISDQAINGGLVFYNSPKVKVHYAEGREAIVVDKDPCNVIIIIDTLSSPRSVSVDWGNTNCDCNDGKQRRGKIVTTFTGRYRDAGTVITHTPIDYYVNNNKIEGYKQVINAGFNVNSQPFFYVTVNGTVTMSTGEVFTYYSERERTWLTGFNTPFDFMDDQYEIAGNAQASSSLGNGYDALITTPLLLKVGCAFVTQGILEFTPVGKAKRTIDYGDGTCDTKFTVTVNGTTYTFN
jgi:hypothetical protein